MSREKREKMLKGLAGLSREEDAPLRDSWIWKGVLRQSGERYSSNHRADMLTLNR